MAAVERIAITLSHRGAVRMAFRNGGSPAAQASGEVIDDEELCARLEKEDARGVGDTVMAENVSTLRRTIRDE
jgi:hypothetical protein